MDCVLQPGPLGGRKFVLIYLAVARGLAGSSKRIERYNIVSLSPAFPNFDQKLRSIFSFETSENQIEINKNVYRITSFSIFSGVVNHILLQELILSL